VSTFSSAARRRDFALLAALRDGSEEALATLHSHYASTLYDFVYSKTKLNDVSQEIVQEIFISLWQRRSTLVIETSLRQYLFGAAKFKVLDYQRWYRIRQSYLAEVERMSGDICVNVIDDLISVDHILESVEHTLRKLPRRARVVFQLSRFEYKTIQEISRQLNISRRTVENYISLVLSELRPILITNNSR
jgi:RNA polymerase sigma-70 factor (ECF subfamily)